ncbi:MAG TPA: LysR family transcriptional regulator [Coriobacteriia bacterium]|nr:LysR family transcriptional regulator [Coriobacteriia bacterium]
MSEVLNTGRLRLLRELAERGTIAAVAEAVYLTPPAVSHQLVVLEQEVGVPLLERSARSVRLTDAGLLLVNHAEKILADCETALAAVASFEAEVSGTVRLSVFQTAAGGITVPALVALRNQHPKLDVITSEMEPTLSVPALKAGQLDVALSHEWDFVPFPDDPGIERIDLLREPAVVLLPHGHRLASSRVRLSDLADERWCVARETTSSRKAISRAAHAAGFEPRIVLESNYFGVIGSAVEAGLGVGIVPAMTDLRNLDVVVRPLAKPHMGRRIFAAVRRGSGASPTIRAVIEALVTTANKVKAAS